MDKKKSEFDKVFSAWDILVIAFGAMIGWGWVVSSGTWIDAGGVVGAALAFAIGGVMIFFVGLTYAELTAAMISHSMGFDRKVTDNSAAYLDSWIGVLKQEPKFIVSVMADVNKASELILDHVDKQRLALNEQPYLTKNDPFAPLGEGEEVPFKNAAIVKTRNGDYAIRASYDGVELGLKKVSKDTAKTYFQLTDYKDKAAFLNMTAHKTFEPELAMMQRTQKTGAKMGI